jgi:hypothetical protein
MSGGRVREVYQPYLTEQEAKQKRAATIEELGALLRDENVTDQQIMWLVGLVASWLEPLAHVDRMTYLQTLQDEMAEALLLRTKNAAH